MTRPILTSELVYSDLRSNSSPAKWCDCGVHGPLRRTDLDSDGSIDWPVVSKHSAPYCVQRHEKFDRSPQLRRKE
jgi:hypothetical protein